MSGRADYSAAALQRLSFRRQFVLGPPGAEVPVSWTRLTIAEQWQLAAHPDLDVCQATTAAKSVTLAGYMLDPERPQAGNSEIVGRLLQALDTCATFWRHTADLGGRWVLVVHDGRDTQVLHDAAGQRSVYYARDRVRGETRCASRPLLVAEPLGLPRDEGARAYFDAQEHDDCDVYWTPGDTSLFQEVRCLLPNHALDLRTGDVHRYWPDTDLPAVPLAVAVEDSLRILQGLMRSARQRFPLALSMTAGWDSRLMLALSRDVKDDLYCFTLLYPRAEHSRDVRVPAALLKRLGLDHHTVSYPSKANDAFKDIYQRNVAASRDTYCADAQGLYEQYPPERVCVTGDVAEIVKAYYRLPAAGTAEVSARDLAALCAGVSHPFQMRAFERWLATAQPRNVHPLDLFCWEQFVGKKQALIRAQYDIVQETFAPLNCRALLATMLSVDERDRRGPEFTLFRTLIERLWRETLGIPVNPAEERRARRIVRRALAALHIPDRVPQRLMALGRRMVFR